MLSVLEHLRDRRGSDADGTETRMTEPSADTLYTGAMQLHVARLCLDCDEVHDAQTCPICSSESFAYISRWLPVPERRARPRSAATSPAAETYRELLTQEPKSSTVGRWLRRGAMGVAAVGVAGWIWRLNAGQQEEAPSGIVGATKSEDR